MPSEISPFLQRDVADFFLRAAASGRLAHAYLLLGPKGVGKGRFATDLVKFLFCLDRASEPAPGHLGSCGQCRNCRRVDHGNLPDLHWFRRQEGKRDIVMEDIDRFQQEMSLKPVEGPWKVFVVEEADRLNVSSANHMLKVLEEPPDYSLILLLAEEEDDILPTIRSRVHVVRFRPQPVADLAAALVREHHAGRDEAVFLARLSAGSPGLALELKEQGFYEKHRRFLESILKMKPSDNFDLAEEIRKRPSRGLHESGRARDAVPPPGRADAGVPRRACARGALRRSGAARPLAKRGRGAAGRRRGGLGQRKLAHGAG